ncbi:proteic killer suppression protein/toxin YoeB [Acholeplasma morum]|uniref:hypothetical protein n=1 Tax=Paracholeplasma morum TaxID=264637 RepID=UPI00195D8B78|nr:hypothetical protein [Paracholeplasma morum]MBM7454131.1 proteic killer suppression protein/toxin YoeB [Paracholeplasma morum]
MEIEFDDKKVQTLFNDFNLMAKKKGPDITKTIKKRYEQLKAAETFAEYLLTGLGKPHPLSGNKDELYGISITGNIRLIVEPVSEDLSIESLKKCIKVIIKGAEDYHGDKITTYIP